MKIYIVTDTLSDGYTDIAVTSHYYISEHNALTKEHALKADCDYGNDINTAGFERIITKHTINTED